MNAKPQLHQINILSFFLISLFLFQTQRAISQENPEKQKVKLLGHAHMDPVYRWRWNEIENREIYKTFTDVLGEMKTHPELQFAQSYLLYYATIQKNFPALFEEVKQSINNKKWSVVGGQWVEPDENLSSGESLIRQFLIAQDYYSKNLGIENVSIAWSPDVFTGHPGTLPKIYAGCGVKNYFFSREAPEGKRIFWWESKDGSRILGYKTPGHYNPDFRNMPDHLKEWMEIADYNLPLVTFGKGDHGGGPGESDFRGIKMLEDNSNLKFEYSSPDDYFAHLNALEKDWPVQKTEFGHQPNGGSFLGCYTSQAIIKKLNRHLENQLIAAEKFSTIGTMHKGKPFYTREDFSEAWKILLFNQFHDIIPGTLTGLASDDVLKQYARLEQVSFEQLNAGLENIGNRINTIEMSGIPLVVYNPHSWQVSQMVNVDVKFATKPKVFNIKDSSGKNIPYSISMKSEDNLKYTICINAKDVPSLGYKVYEVVEETSESFQSDLKLSNNSIENSSYIIKWDEIGISSIFSKKLQKEILKDNGNCLQLLEDNGSSWSLGLTGKEYAVESLKSPEVVLQSPLKMVIKWEDVFQSSKFIRYMTVYSNSDQIDFEMEVDWHSHNKLLRLVFPTSVSNGEAYYDQPYGYVQRAENGNEFPAQKWIDYSNKEFGVSLLNDGKYGFTIKDGVLTMSVVRGARDMDPRMDEGIHSFKYSIIVHEGNWRDADIPQKALELNQPLIARQENHHPGEISGWKYSEQSFPLEKSFFGIESDHVIISSLKVKQDAYDPNPVILRIVETEGRNEVVTVNLPYEPVSVIECNHLEQEMEPRSNIQIENNKFRFEMGHDQIRTFLVRF